MAGERGYILGPRDGDRLRDMLRSQGERGQPRAARPRDPLVCFVRVTSGTATDGWYPGQWQEVQPDASMADGGDAWVRDAAGAALNNGAKYLTQCVGMDAGGVPMFATVAVSVAGGLSGVGVSPTPPLHVSTAGGVATVSLDSAAHTGPGYVTTTDQLFAGDKGTVGALYSQSDVPLSPIYYQGAIEGGPGADGLGVCVLYAVCVNAGGPYNATVTARLEIQTGRGVFALPGTTDAFAVGLGATRKTGIYTTRTVQGAGVDAGLRITWEFAGGILVSETVAAGASGSGSGTASILGCCADTALPDTLTLTLPDTSEVALEWNQGNSWIGGEYTMGCWDLGSGLKWYLSFGLTVVEADGGGTCDPFDQTFVDGGNTYEVTE